MSLKYELQNIISGNGTVRHGETIQAITNYLRGKNQTIFNAEKSKLFKKQEEQTLVTYVNEKKLWFDHIDFSKYIGEGAEQKIFESSDPNYILKLNDSIFYETWLDYFNSLLIHNFFFPHLAYQLIGFNKQLDKVCALVKQPYVKSTEPTDLNNVKEFLEANGFENKKNNDYFNPKLGIILEDLHDENVLTENGVLQFIDTVFYLTPTFYTIK